MSVREEAAADALDALPPGVDAELFLREEQTWNAELEPATGATASREGLRLRGAARVWQEGRVGEAFAPHLDAAALLASAAPRAPGAPPPVPLARESGSDAVEPSREALLGAAERLRSGLLARGLTVQALLVQDPRITDWRVRRGAPAIRQRFAAPQLLARIETPRGAMLESCEPDGVETLLLRVDQACSAVAGQGRAVDRRLPLVFRPAVAVPLVAALATLLRGDVAGATPALARALGKRLFPACLTLVDAPPAARLDDEGVVAAPVTLISRGQLAAFLHSSATAAAMGLAPNGRGLRTGEALQLGPGALGLRIQPASGGLPERCTELTTRLETFTSLSRAGSVSLIVAGWERRGDARLYPVEPFELELPVLPTLRRLAGVGEDLTFFPAAEGCGTPTLVFDSLT